MLFKFFLKAHLDPLIDQTNPNRHTAGPPKEAHRAAFVRLDSQALTAVVRAFNRRKEARAIIVQLQLRASRRRSLGVAVPGRQHHHDH